MYSFFDCIDEVSTSGGRCSDSKSVSEDNYNNLRKDYEFFPLRKYLFLALNDTLYLTLAVVRVRLEIEQTPIGSMQASVRQDLVEDKIYRILHNRYIMRCVPARI